LAQDHNERRSVGAAGQEQVASTSLSADPSVRGRCCPADAARGVGGYWCDRRFRHPAPATDARAARGAGSPLRPPPFAKLSPGRASAHLRLCQTVDFAANLLKTRRAEV